MEGASFRWSAAILTAIACASEAPQPAPIPEVPATEGTWRLTAPMLTPRAAHSLTVLNSGKVLAAGGDKAWSVAGAESLASAEIYEPDTETWTATGSMGSPRSFHIAVLLGDGKVLVAGGCARYDGSDHVCVPLATAEIYDPEQGTWSPTGSMAHARGRGGMADAAAVLLDGRVVVLGSVTGTDPLVFGSASEVYDPASQTWSQVGDAVDAADGRSVVGLDDGRVLAVGAFGEDDAASAVAQIYEPSAAAWRAAAPFHRPVVTNTLTRLGDGRVLSFGGCDVAGAFPCGSPMDATAWLFDPASETWRPTAPIVYPRMWASAVSLPSGRVLVAGGNSQIFPLSGTNFYAAPAGEIYDPQRDTWTPTPVMPHYVNVASGMAVLPSGDVLFTGGILWDGVEGTNDHILPISAAQMFRE